MTFKKLLIVTDGFLNDGTGSGVTLYNLFKGWEINKLAVFSSSLNSKGRKILIGEECFSNQIFLNKNQTKHQKKTFFSNIKKKFNHPSLRPYLTLFAPIKIPLSIADSIRNFKPELIYAPVSDIYSIRRVLKLRNISKVPISTVFFDDLIDRYDGMMLSLIYKWIHFQYLKYIVRNSKKNFVCSQAMKEEYENIFKTSFEVVSNPVDLEVTNKYKSDGKKKTPFRIVYAGTINSKNINNLTLMSQAIEELCESGHEIIFNVYTFQSKLKKVSNLFERFKSTSIQLAPIEDHDLFDVLGNSSILYLPMDFSKESVKSIRLSYLTKQPLYMSLGVPLIVHGPIEIHVVRHAHKFQYAEVITNNCIQDLKSCVLDHLNNYEHYVKKTALGRKYAEENHSIRQVQDWFYATLLDST